MLYPLKFKPILKERIWGGERLISQYGKKPPKSNTRYGESWEISGVEGSVSEVTNGFLAGNNLQELVEIYMGDLVGDRNFERFGEEFPLLIKFIDTSEYLSIQVHPDDNMAKRLHHAYGKCEMWYVIDSEPESTIITGFDQKITREEYLNILNSGTLVQCLKHEKVASDDFFYIPSRSVHAIGKGVLLVEIQQTSDITYRIFDWDRVDENGKARELHTDLALDAIDFENPSFPKESRKIIPNTVQDIISKPVFNVNRLVLSKAMERDFINNNSFRVYVCISGGVNIYFGEKVPVYLVEGESILVPAVINSVTLKPIGEGKLLEVFL